MKTDTYIRKPFEVDAIQVTVENMAEVAKWCQGTVRSSADGKYIKVRVMRPANVRQSQAFVGDWVLYAGTGYKVYGDRAFQKSFQQSVVYTEADAKAQVSSTEELRVIDEPADGVALDTVTQLEKPQPEVVPSSVRFLEEGPE